MKKATQRIAWGVVVRGTVAVMGQATTGLGFVERTPPDAIEQRAFFAEEGAS